MIRKRHSLLSRLPFSLRLVCIFLLTSLLTLGVSLYLNQDINRSLNRINSVYTSNDTLNQMSTTLDAIQNNLLAYLETRSTDSLNQ